MRAIILAAGRGTRISKDIGDIPKSTLRINGKAIIRRTVEILLELGIDVCVCTGYRAELIRQELVGLNVEYRHNPFYDVTNNIASLWFAQDFFMGEDTVIFSADVVLSKETFKKVITKPHMLEMVVDRNRVLDGDYFFELSKDGDILQYGPNVAVEKRSCEYVGIAKVAKETSGLFVNALNELIRNGKHGIYFENVFFEYINDREVQLSTTDISGALWREIDNYSDYQKAMQEFGHEF